MTKREIKQLAERVGSTEKNILDNKDFWERSVSLEQIRRYKVYKDAMEAVVKWFKRLINIS